MDVVLLFTMIIGLDVFADNPFASRSSPFFASLLGFSFYLCLVVFLVGAFEGLIRRWSDLRGMTRGILKLMIIVGGLALPIYAFHGVVIPAKDILKILGLPGAIALLLPLTTFLAMMGYFGWRLKRMYFG